MLIERLNTKALESLLSPHMERPLWPGIRDPQVMERAQRYARQSGLWDELSETLRQPRPLPELRFSEYQHYLRTGSREPYQSALNALSDAVDLAALGLWLGHPTAEVDYLQDLLWKWCCNPWQMPAHHGQHIELYSTRVARQLAEYAWLFGDRFDDGLLERIDRELSERILEVAHDWRRNEHWNTRDNNWNFVCNGDIVQVGLYRIRSARDLAAFVHPLIRRMDYALQSFPPDGGCVEGAGYWEYGVGHFLNVAIALRERTGGTLNIADDPHIHNILRYPLAVQLTSALRARFADCGNGYVSARAALQVQHLTGCRGLLRLVEPLPGNLLRMSDIRTLSLYTGEQPDHGWNERDWYLPDTQYVKVTADGVVLAAVAGNNGVSHNHNDVGSFILVVNGREIVTDPGAPIYTAQTFGAARYDMLFCNSFGHSVPVVNGRGQAEGERYSGTLECEGLNSSGTKQITIQMAGAYDEPSLRELRRQLVIERNGRVTQCDRYSFEVLPKAVEEVWITFETVTIDEEGAQVRIGPPGGATTLTSAEAGRFSVETVPPDRHQGQDPRSVHRIRFAPTTLEPTMTLRFDFAPRATDQDTPLAHQPVAAVVK